MAGARGDELAALVYTPGTTGPPKGVMLTHANVDFVLRQFVLWPERYADRKVPGPRDLVVSYLPLAYLAERVFSSWSLVAGGSVVHFVEAVDTVETDLREVQPTIFFGVPRVWERLHGVVLARARDASWFKRRVVGFGLGLGRRVGRTRASHGGKDTVGSRLAYILGWILVFRALRQRIGLRRARHAAVGGGPIAPEVLEFFLGIGVPVLELYGLTESAFVATTNLPRRLRLGTAGRPCPDVDVRIDPTTGEIQVRHDGNFAGYWNSPDATAAAPAPRRAARGDSPPACRPAGRRSGARSGALSPAWRRSSAPLPRQAPAVARLRPDGRGSPHGSVPRGGRCPRRQRS